MGGQLGPRLYENLTLTGPPVDALKQPVLPRYEAERAAVLGSPCKALSGQFEFG
jgi:hypothetical protein